MSSAFRQAIERGIQDGSLDELSEVLAPDVVFRSPAVFKPYEGREAVMGLLTLVSQVFEDFEYLDELHGDGTEALIFRARVGDREVEGLDYVRVNEAGLVSELRVMIRPLSGLLALAEAMQKKLEAAGAI